jgi:cytochrome b
MNTPRVATPVWDLPLRLFHWSLVALVIGAVAAAKIGSDEALVWHERCGRAILVLVVFRLFWGVAGSPESRFAAFVRGPCAVLASVRELFRRDGAHARGHNPLGGWAVIVMLVVLLAQAMLGLFANDDATFEGPLAGRVSKATSDLLTGLHGTGEWVLYGVVGLHLSAIAWHALVKGDNLVMPMITGDKQLPVEGTEAPDRRTVTGPAMLLRAAILLAIAAAIVLPLTARG